VTSGHFDLFPNLGFFNVAFMSVDYIGLNGQYKTKKTEGSGNEAAIPKFKIYHRTTTNQQKHHWGGGGTKHCRQGSSLKGMI
jgi:hypothetical protein